MPRLTQLLQTVADWADMDPVSQREALRRLEEAEHTPLRLLGRVVDFHRPASRLDVSEPVQPRLIGPDQLPGDWARWALVRRNVPRLGQRWKHLVVRSRVWTGHASAIYRAYDPFIKHIVALKIGAHSTPSPARLSILHEARILAEVWHPSVVRFLGSGEDEGTAGYWMEFVEGRTLDRLLTTGRLPDLAQTLTIVQQVCDGLSALHRAGIVHGDISARNVMQTATGRAVIVDFGESQTLKDPQPSTKATLLYAPPEILRGQPRTVRSDVYSVGMLLMQLVARQRAHGQSSHAETAVPPSELMLAIPRPLWQVIELATAADPAQRYASIEAMSRDLLLANPSAAPWSASGETAKTDLLLVAPKWERPRPPNRFDVQDTASLFDEAVRGDQDALEIVAERYRLRLRRFAHGRVPSLVRSVLDTADLVQDTLMSAVQKFADGEFARHHIFAAYLRQTLLSKLTVAADRAARSGVHNIAAQDAIAADHLSPLDRMIDASEVHRYDRALQRLSARDRDLIVGRLEQQENYEKVAAALKLPSVNAARVAVRRALTRLAAEISREDHASDERRRPRGRRTRADKGIVIAATRSTRARFHTRLEDLDQRHLWLSQAATDVFSVKPEALGNAPRDVRVDVTAFLKGEVDPDRLCFLILYPSGALRSLHARVEVVRKRTWIVSPAVAFVDPDAPTISAPKSNRIDLLGLVAPSVH